MRIGDKGVMIMMTRLWRGFGLMLLCLLAGCAANTDKYLNAPAKGIYQAGKGYLERGSYTAAINAYENLSTQYPFGQYSKKADLDIIYAYYANGDSAMALAAANAFIKLYPNNPHLDYAIYMRGILNFNAGRGFIQKYFPYDMAAHDATNYDLAFNDFSALITRYPNSVYVHDARRRMIYINNIIGDQDLMVAQFYQQKGAYVGAIRRAMHVLLAYPNTPSVKGAFDVLVNSYKALGLTDYAGAYEQTYRYNYPAVTQPMAKTPIAVVSKKNKA